MSFKLGDKVKDTVTGFTGTVAAKCEYLQEPEPAYGVETLTTDGQHAREWFGEARLELVP